MLQLFSRTRAHRFAHPVDGDVGCAHSRVVLVARSIEWSLRAAQAEQADLSRRLEELTARALVPLGNGTDEYLTRDSRDNRRLDKLEQKMLQAERSLRRLAHDIAHFQFLRTALKVRFPDLNPSSERH